MVSKQPRVGAVPGGDAAPVSAAIQAFVDELIEDAGVRGVALFGSHARGTAKIGSDADLVILVDQPGFVMGCAERGSQEFEMVRLSEATALRYFTDNRDHAADVWPTAKILYDPVGGLGRVRDHALALVSEGKPAIDKARIEWSRFAAADRFRAAARLAETDVTAARMVLHEKVLELTATYFDVRRLWTPPMKRRLAAIGDQDQEFYELLETFFGSNGTLDEQLRLAHIALALVYGKDHA